MHKSIGLKKESMEEAAGGSLAALEQHSMSLRRRKLGLTVVSFHLEVTIPSKKHEYKDIS